MEKTDNGKYLIFGYNIANTTDIVFNFKETNQEEIIPFTRILFPPHYFNGSKEAHYSLFYISLGKTKGSNKSFRIIQSVKKTIGGECNYYSLAKKLKNNNDDEFLFDINFEKNEEYTFHKKPEGKPIDKLDLIKLFINFLVSQKDPLKMTEYFINDFENKFYTSNQKSVQKFVLNTKNEIESFLEFITSIYVSQISASQSESRKQESRIGCFILFLGLISNKGFETCDKNKIGSILIDAIVDFFKSKRAAMHEIFNSNIMIKYFKKGLVYAFSACCFTKDSVGYLFPFIISLMELRDIDLSEKIIVDESTQSGLIKFPLAPDIWREIKSNVNNYFKDINRIGPVLLEIFNFSLATLIEFIQVILEKDKDFDIANFLSKNKQIIIDIIIYENDNYHSKASSREEYNRFQSFNKSTNFIFKDFSKEIYINFIRNSLDSDLTLELLDKEELDNASSTDEVWKTISEILNAKKGIFALDQLVSLCERAQSVSKKFKGENSQEAYRADTLIRKQVIEKLKQISIFDKFELRKYLNSRIIFPYGCLKYLEDNILKKLNTPEDFKFIIEVVLEQFDYWEKDDAENVIKELFDSTLKYKYANNLILGRIVNEVLNRIRMRSEKLAISLFQDFLEHFFQIHKNDILEVLKNMPDLLQNSDFEDAFVKFVEKTVYLPKKQKKKKEILNFLTEFTHDLEKLKIVASTKEKLLFALLSSTDNCIEKKDDFISELLKNPTRDHFIFKILSYTKGKKNFENLVFIKNVQDGFKDLLNRTSEKCVFLSEVEMLKKLSDAGKTILIDLIKFSMQEENRNDKELDQIIMDCIAYTENKICELNLVKELLVFLIRHERKADILKAHLGEIVHALSITDEILVKDFAIPQTCLVYLDFSKYFEIFKTSSSFDVIFTKIYENENKLKQDNLAHDYPKKYSMSLKYKSVLVNALKNINPEKNEVNVENNEANENKINFQEITKSIENLYRDLFENLKTENNLKNTLIQEYFSKLKTKQDIKREIDVLKSYARQQSIKDFTNEMFLFDSIWNLKESNELKYFFQNLLSCFKSFRMKTNDLAPLLNEYINATSREEFEVALLNNLVNKIYSKLDFLLKKSKDEEIITTINEIGESNKLIEFALDKNEQDLRNLIEGLDEHGDGHIRVHNIIELCKVTKFLNKLNTQNELDFINSIIGLIEQDVQEKNYLNISGMIRSSSNLLESIVLITDTLQNREEASKVKILEMARNSEFKIEFETKTQSFNLTTLFKGKKKLSLNDLYDLRDRALLMINNQSNSIDNYYDISQENIEESKRLNRLFIKSVELLNDIVTYLNQSFKNGYPVDELHGTIKLNVKNKNNDEIVKFEELISKEYSEWQEQLKLMLGKYSILSYFWGREILILQDLFIKKDIRRIKNHLYFINSNILNLEDDLFPPYPVKESYSAAPIKRLQILAEHVCRIFDKLPPAPRIEIKSRNNSYSDYSLEESRQEQIILIKTSHYKYYVNALIVCFRDYEKHFPLSNQVNFVYFYV
jgi:hypothetical protein